MKRLRTICCISLISVTALAMNLYFASTALAAGNCCGSYTCPSGAIVSECTGYECTKGYVCQVLWGNCWISVSCEPAGGNGGPG